MNALDGLNIAHRYKDGSKKKKTTKNKNKSNQGVIKQRAEYIGVGNANKADAAHLLGCLHIKGHISDLEYEASKVAAIHFCKYRIMMGLPPANMQIISLDHIPGSSDWEPTEKSIIVAKSNIDDIREMCNYLAEPNYQSFCKPHQFKDRAYQLLIDILERDEIPADNWFTFSYSLKFKILKLVLSELVNFYKLQQK